MGQRWPVIQESFEAQIMVFLRNPRQKPFQCFLYKIRSVLYSPFRQLLYRTVLTHYSGARCLHLFSSFHGGRKWVKSLPPRCHRLSKEKLNFLEENNWTLGYFESLILETVVWFEFLFSLCLFLAHDRLICNRTHSLQQTSLLPAQFIERRIVFYYIRTFLWRWGNFFIPHQNYNQKEPPEK